MRQRGLALGPSTIPRSRSGLGLAEQAITPQLIKTRSSRVLSGENRHDSKPVLQMKHNNCA